MEVLITGGEGHIGSHLADLLAEDNNVTSLDNGFNSNSYYNPKVLYIREHTKNIGSLDIKPDIIYHLGEYARLAPSFDEPETVYDLNTLGTLAVVQFCLKNSIKLVYGASSTKFSDPSESPYTFSKSTNVELIKNYGKWYGLNYAICYFYNAYGGRENGQGKYATLIARFQHLSQQGKPLTVVLPGTQKRNFTHVEDIVRGIKLVGEQGTGDGYALNYQKAYSVLDIAQILGGDIKYIDGHAGRKESGDTPNKARELGWEAGVDVIEYLSRYQRLDHGLS